jgi:hypothetical protein
MADQIANKLSEHTYLARSGIFGGAAEAYNLIKVPKNAFIMDVWLEVITIHAANTCTVGFAGNGETADPDGFIDATLGVTDTAAFIRALDDAQPGSKAKWFSDGVGMITATPSGTTSRQRLFVKYAIIS